MKSVFKRFGIIYFFLMIVFSITGCKDDVENDPIIPVKWQGTYTGGGETISISANGNLSWAGWSIPNGSVSNVTIVKGGTFSVLGLTGGEWVYVAFNGVYNGIILDFPESFDGSQFGEYRNIKCIIGLGYTGTNQLLNMGSTMNITTSPQPNISNFKGFPSEGYYGLGAK